MADCCPPKPQRPIKPSRTGPRIPPPTESPPGESPIDPRGCPESCRSSPGEPQIDSLVNSPKQPHADTSSCCVSDSLTQNINNSNLNNDHVLLHEFKNKICAPLSNEPPAVLNLSDHTLSSDELSLLEKGLNFCPTPGEPHLGDLRRDLDNFHRRLKIKAFFDPLNTRQSFVSSQNPNSETDLDNSSDDDSLTPTNDSPVQAAIKKSKVIKNDTPWQPSVVPVPLKAYIISNESDLNKTFVKSPHSHNITRTEKQALKDLSSNANIVIKKADKSATVVIQNRTDYVKEAERQLSDSFFYKEVEDDLTSKHNEEINTILDDLTNRGQLNKGLSRKLKTTTPRTSQLYLLPKIHKPQRPPPGRPIVSANGCPTEKISALVDIYLRPYLVETKSYLRDTMDLLNKLEHLGTLPPECILGTLDVTSLYTNIPNTEGCQSIFRLLQNKRTPLPNELSNTSVCRLLWSVLSKNNFQFNDKHYLQVNGTAMGTRVAPTYANLFMADFEERFVYTHPKKPIMWTRFIDDIFFIWPHGQEELDLFIQHLNESHQTIKFTAESSSSSVNFLDLTIKMERDRTLSTSLFVKPTDSASYLHFDSAHPSHCIKGIPYGQFLRIRRICSKEADFIAHCVRKGQHFVRRGYPVPFIGECFLKALRRNRTSLMAPNPKRDTDEKPNILITTYNPGFRGLKNVVQKNWDLLGKSFTTRAIYREKVLSAFRRPKNLKDYLVRAKLKPESPETSAPSSNRCLRPNTCRYCPKLNTDGRILCSASGRTYMSRFNVCCSSSNLIYCITCKRCGIQYVGQTKCELKVRFSAHFLKISKNDPESEIARHFNSEHHMDLDDVSIHIVDFIYSAPDSPRAKHLRDLLEFNWIQRLHTNAPMGLNVMDLLRSNTTSVPA